ncbi:MAG: cobalamin biosynthesis protein CbiM [Omnitrophica bacterium RIFCSPLOWO2_12_FULL_44_17]|uniref:Cobalamin biosynthesis protein CbiM n=1 Tax=Candidatus Danuiimicrobium aquiferis TaxID=1801832 RepID=A0A1G1KV27_9BACT|nr:MAG: cobalamin biosynthesis protein CbiM [Omnitrophica bacterium RIFCSPHIGHO2_02_FULL_45_28]OGW88684.1 MAG: cobalamin biosynthesis protein CbiM [Omnitrophica bacterium RIFCSPHIGHO2_12_FULL_44_12]OGW96793.1 MAG: cobalamin biosynthesis protein CbiM [Omnitrophica bacterium RIFCSPLOWO2_12_FULL_44_17]OGX03794.1 MAG: cobalamin biosynthesis protein CbiM [Omnitrophica bacterium RIFCSPLOWO2_02_FULL_44_11]
MHIPPAMLHGQICPVTAAVSVLGVAGAAYVATKSKQKPSASRFGAIAALIFAGQMMNFPVLNGTSGHLLGGVLASALLGIPFGILAMTLILAIQSLVFSDGGLTTLGANVLNIAIVGAGIGGWFYSKLSDKQPAQSISQMSSLAFASWLSVVMAAFACSVELAVSGTVAFSTVTAAMIGVQAVIGIAEAVLTVAMYRVFSAGRNFELSKGSVKTPLLAAILIGLMLSPLASSFPDGLGWIAQKYQFLHEAAPAFVSPLADYTIASMGTGWVSTGLAGMIGVLLTFSLGWFIGKGICVYHRG